MPRPTTALAWSIITTAISAISVSRSGYFINPTRQRRGLAGEAVRAMLDFCFGELALHRVQAFIHPDNTASRGLAEKLGFRCEGVLRHNLRVGEEWRDDMLYALLATERGS